MQPLDAIVVAAAAAALVWVNWYFFSAHGSSATAVAGDDGRQELEVVVEGGYRPAVLKVIRGRPVRLVFDRREESSCSEEVVLPDFGLRRFLPAHERTAVEFTPERSGRFEFTCGMGMLRGRLDVVEPGTEGLEGGGSR